MLRPSRSATLAMSRADDYRHLALDARRRARVARTNAAELSQLTASKRTAVTEIDKQIERRRAESYDEVAAALEEAALMHDALVEIAAGIPDRQQGIVILDGERLRAKEVLEALEAKEADKG